jgi:membrane protease YdiL (CAAX protease family)
LKESAFCLNIGIASNGIITLVLLFINYIIDMLLWRFLELFSDTTTTDIVLTGHPFWLLLLSTGILVPIMEEIVFRYGLCGTLARNNKKTALIVSAIIFGVVHGNIIQAAYATVLGLIMGMLYLKYENLIYPIIVHITINSSSVIVSEIGHEWIICAVGLVSLVICILMIKSQPELKEFKFLKEKKELKPLPSLRDTVVQEESVIETHDFKEE